MSNHMTMDEAFTKAERIFHDLSMSPIVKQQQIRRNDGTIGVQCEVGYWPAEGYRNSQLWGGTTFEEAFEEWRRWATTSQIERGT